MNKKQDKLEKPKSRSLSRGIRILDLWISPSERKFKKIWEV